MSQFYGPKPPDKQQTTEPGECEFIRFILKSGAALELRSDTIEEVVETWADKACKAVCGCKVNGKRAAVPVDNIDYMEEA